MDRTPPQPSWERAAVHRLLSLIRVLSCHQLKFCLSFERASRTDWPNDQRLDVDPGGGLSDPSNPSVPSLAESST